ncbi:hypothetical protein NKG94_50500 [Micromonospora sp. M12]
MGASASSAPSIPPGEGRRLLGRRPPWASPPWSAGRAHRREEQVVETHDAHVLGTRTPR